MKLDSDKVRRLAESQGISLSALLVHAGVNRTEYYSLVRRPSVLPKTIHALAHALGVRAGDLLDEEAADVQLARARLQEAKEICAANPDASFENVWHTLCLLDETPIDRLNRSLIRGRTAGVHR